MQKVRVYQLAKELNVQSALILELLDRLGQEVRSDLSMLDADTAELVRKRVTSAIKAETKRIMAKRTDGPAVEDSEVAAEEAPTESVAEPAAAAGTTAAPTPERKPAAPAATRKPAAPRTPVRRPTAPGGSVPEAPLSRAAKPVGTAPGASAGAARATPPPKPGAPKRRVFEAKRIPTAAELARSTTRPGRRPGPGGAAAGGPAGPGGMNRPAGPGGMNRPGGPGSGPAGTAGRPVRPGMPPMPGMPGRPPGPGRGKKRRKKDRSKERAAEMMAAAAKPKADLPPVPEKITLTEGVTVKELGEKLNRKSKDVISKLISRGVLATINQPLDPEVAIDVAKEFGSEATVISFEEEAQLSAPVTTPDEFDLEIITREENMVPRPPVVTVMGHVDHGKTSLLDAVRETKVADDEAGGITQHIGAYQAEAKGRKITFLDTPGHEAFTLMRARGAKATDVVVLVVAADDGVKPQTQEAIDHAKAAGVPLVVAINKIDKPNANVDRVKQQLAERELVVESYGGDIVSCEVSAKNRTGIDELLEMILLVADLTDLKADPTSPATGVALEARLDRGRGILATVLVQGGTLRVGDHFIAGTAYGKVRAMADEKGNKLKEAGPSTPVEVMGFAAEPGAGDSFQAVKDEAKARQISAFRKEKKRVERGHRASVSTLEQLSAQIAAGDVKELPVLMKCDVQGSIEALQKSLGDIPADKVRINVIRTGIGAISQADVLLAAASGALIIGFNVRPDRAAIELAEKENVEMRLYTIIYEMIDEIRAAMVGMLEPTIRESVLGQAEVRDTFKISRLGTIAGCLVTSGKVTRKAEVRLLRDNVVIHTGRLTTLRRFKDDVAEVKQGYECGIHIDKYNDVKLGDVIEFFVKEKIAAESL